MILELKFGLATGGMVAGASLATRMVAFMQSQGVPVDRTLITVTVITLLGTTITLLGVPLLMFMLNRSSVRQAREWHKADAEEARALAKEAALLLKAETREAALLLKEETRHSAGVVATQVETVATKVDTAKMEAAAAINGQNVQLEKIEKLVNGTHQASLEKIERLEKIIVALAPARARAAPDVEDDTP